MLYFVNTIYRMMIYAELQGNLSLAVNSQVAAFATSDTVTNLAKASAGVSRIINTMNGKDVVYG